MALGRKPKGEYPNRTKVFSTRITEAGRTAIEDAARASGRSISQEIEHRLRRSFDEDTSLVDRLGGRKLYTILRMVSSTMEIAGRHALFLKTREIDTDWLNDPYAYDQVVRAVADVLERLRPPGDPAPPRIGPDEIRVQEGDDPVRAASDYNTLQTQLGTLLAGYVTQRVGAADPIQPLPGGSPDAELASRIADGLGDLHGRLKRTIDPEKEPKS